MKIIAGMGSWIELKYPAYQGRDEIGSTQIPRVERTRAGKRVRLRNGTVINPGGPVLFLRSARTADRRPPLYRSMSGPAGCAGSRPAPRRIATMLPVASLPPREH